ncbi:MAG: hypothetical protein QNK36_19075 [Colwellia sp.]|nr:hypothetical protein [Colwellia sp.]
MNTNIDVSDMPSLEDKFSLYVDFSESKLEEELRRLHISVSILNQ